jgi:hypothetical protein
MLPARLRWLILCLAAGLSACAGGRYDVLNVSAKTNAAPTNAKADILAFLRTYLNDPTNIRDTALTEPLLLRVGTEPRYVVCVRFNAKNANGKFAGVIDTAAVFNAAKLDRFIDLTPDPNASDAAIRAQLREPCRTAAYRPFPELQQLTR